MNIKSFYAKKVNPDAKSEFRIYALNDNLRRTKIFALVVIVLEFVLAASVVLSEYIKVEQKFHFTVYMLMYSIMIIVNAVFLLYINKLGPLEEKSKKFLNLLEIIILVYITFMLCWGSVVSLLDQELYGHLTVFMVNMIVCSVLYYIESKKMILPFTVSILILSVGLPFFQPTRDVLLGHYINLVIFVTISFVCSRTLYNNYCHDFNNTVLLQKMHDELQQLSYMDELTCLPNRRSFNSYIDENYIRNLKDENQISIVMIDIDFFKQYNDKYGHIAGDKVLVQVAEQISGMIEEFGDFAARIGGEEFIWFSQNKTVNQMFDLADELRRKVLELKVPHYYSRYHYLTISLGIATLSFKSAEEVYKGIELADIALYNAKACGRNCVKLSELEFKERQETLAHGQSI